MTDRIIVTGGAGFIGSHIATALVERGHEVVVVDNLSTGKRENIAHLDGRIEFVRGSVADEDLLDEILPGTRCVYHEAAVASVPRSVAEPLPTHDTNITATLRLLEGARRHGVKRFVFAASSAAYGDGEEPVKTEDLLPRPLSPYAVHKLACEQYLRVYHSLHGVETVALRYFNVFGARQDPKSEYAAVIPKFITRMLNGERPIIFGDGLQSRDFIHVDNIVKGNLLAMESETAPGEVINLGCGASYSLIDLVEALNDVMKTEFDPLFEPAKPGDVRHSHAGIGRAQALLGFEPEVSFRDGLAKTVAWFEEARASVV
ncbi:MAG: SDR family oxidoreductase [Sumerlaeia bacterium]